MQPAVAAAATATDLRPLPIGELLDRAFHLYFKNFVAFVAILAVVLVPHSIVQYFQSKDFLDVFISILQQHPKTGPPDLTKLSNMSTLNGWFGLDLAILFLALPLANAAAVVGVSKAYLGQPVLFADCYRAALQRWLAVLILLILWLIAFVAGVFVFAIAGGVIIAMLSFLASGLHGSSLAGAGIAFFFIVLTLAFLALFIMLYFTFALSFISVVLERVDPVRAFGTAFSRVFGGHQLWRSVALALALAAIQLAMTLVAYATGGLLAFFLKSPALYVVVLSLLQLVYLPFALLAVGVFYYDVRIRREGFDLQLLAEQLTNPSSSPAPSV